MVNIPIRDIPGGIATPNGQALLAMDNGISVLKTTVSQVVLAGRPTATQQEAIDGADSLKAMTPLTVAQAIASQGPNLFASRDQGARADAAFPAANAGALATRNTVSNNEWSGLDLAVENGGTGASTPAAARSSLGVPSVSEAVAIAVAQAPGFDSVAAAAAVTQPAERQSLRTAGYNFPGDGGGALYRRTVSEPSHGGKFRSVDGAWWELSGTAANIKQFGARGNGSDDDTAAVQAALDSPFRSAMNVNSGTYLITATLRLRAGTSVLLEDSAVIVGRFSDSNRSYIFLNVDYGDTETSGYAGDGNILIDGGKFTFTEDSTTGTFAGITHCIGFTWQNSKITRWRGRHVVDLAGVRRAKFQNIELDESRYNDAYNSRTVHEAFQIDYCGTSSFPAGGAVDNTVCDDVMVDNCRFLDVATAVGTHHAEAFKHTNINITRNLVTNCHNEAFRLRHYVDGEFSGNTVRGAGNRAAQIWQSERIKVSANSFLDTSQREGVSQSVVYFNNCKDCVFTEDNSIGFTGAVPLYVTAISVGSGSSPSTDTLIEIGNVLPGTSNRLVDEGVRTRVKGSTSYVIPNNQAIAVSLPYGNTGTAIVALSSRLSTGVANPRGLLWAKCDTSPLLERVGLVNEANVTLTTGILTGTTGPAGNFTVSAGNDGKLYLENRTGSNRRINVEFLAAGP